MIKKYFLLVFISLFFLLTGCEDEKIITIKNSQHNNLFSTTITTLQKEIPEAIIYLDIPSRTVFFNNKENEQYPPYLEMSFLQNNFDTDIYFTTKDTNRAQLENLQNLLKSAFENIKPRSTESNNLPARRIDQR